MIKAALGAVAAIIVAVLAAIFGTHYFSSTHTRLSDVPKQISAAVAPNLPRPPAHIVIVIEENKQLADIAGKTGTAPYLNDLIARGALFTRSYGVAHPSQPNYIALFSGLTDTNGDGCPPAGIDKNAVNLSTELRGAHRSFAGYAEDLPQPGSRMCSSGEYARKHVPWASFSNVPANEILPLAELPRPYGRLPTVAFVIPNLLNDMHSASIERGDAWLATHLRPLVVWAMSHDTLVIVTWDESDQTIANHIPTIFVGPMVKRGRYDEPITHFRVLRTIEDFYGLPHAGRSASVPPIADVWLRSE